MISSLLVSTRRITAAIIGAAALASLPAAAEQVTVERDSELRAEARLESPVTAKVAQGTTGEVVAKSGAWLHLKTPEASGWLFSFNVRFTGARIGGESGTGSVFGRLFGPRRNVSVTATLGVRGLEEEDLRQAKFDAAQMKLLEQYTAGPDESAERARAAGLVAVTVDYLEGVSP